MRREDYLVCEGEVGGNRTSALSLVGASEHLSHFHDRFWHGVDLHRMFTTGVLIFSGAFLLGTSLWVAAAVWGFLAGAGVIAFVVPLEMPEVGPALAGSALGVALTAGYIGGFVGPLICMRLAETTPVAGFAFGGGCYALSGLLFLLLKETGPRVRRANREV